MKKLICTLLACLLTLNLAACVSAPDTTTGDSGSKSLDMAKVYTDITKGVDMPEMILLDADTTLDLTGVKANDCKQCIVYICADGLRTDEIWLIEATDEAAIAGLRSLVDARLEAKAAESKTYSPEQYAIVQSAQMFFYGQYLALFVSPEVETLADNFSAALSNA